MFEKALYWSGRYTVGTLSHLLLDMDVKYHAPLPDGPKIIAANHPTTTDPFLVTTIVPEQLHILVSDTLFKVPLFGRYLRAAGHVKVIQGNLSAFRDAVRLLNGGHSIAIFPEGHLSPLTGGCHPARSGLARLALATGAPVIPVGINLQQERIHFVQATVDGHTEESRWYAHGRYAMTVGEPVCFSGDSHDHDLVDSIGGQVMRRIMRLSNESGRRLMSSSPVICQPVSDTAEIPGAHAG